MRDRDDGEERSAAAGTGAPDPASGNDGPQWWDEWLDGIGLGAGPVAEATAPPAADTTESPGHALVSEPPVDPAPGHALEPEPQPPERPRGELAGAGDEGSADDQPFVEPAAEAEDEPVAEPVPAPEPVTAPESAAEQTAGPVVEAAAEPAPTGAEGTAPPPEPEPVAADERVIVLAEITGAHEAGPEPTRRRSDRVHWVAAGVGVVLVAGGIALGIAGTRQSHATLTVSSTTSSTDTTVPTTTPAPGQSTAPTAPLALTAPAPTQPATKHQLSTTGTTARAGVAATATTKPTVPTTTTTAAAAKPPPPPPAPTTTLAPACAASMSSPTAVAGSEETIHITSTLPDTGGVANIDYGTLQDGRSFVTDGSGGDDVTFTVDPAGQGGTVQVSVGIGSATCSTSFAEQ